MVFFVSIVTYGVLRDIWVGNADNNHFDKAMSIVHLRGYPNYPIFSHIIENFTTPAGSRVFYGQRLRAFFRAPLSGTYKFTMTCPRACDLYFTHNPEATKRLLEMRWGYVCICFHGMNLSTLQSCLVQCKLRQPTKVANFSFRPKTETSDELALVAGELYSLEAVIVVAHHSSEFSLGFEHVESGLVKNPIGKEYLVWKSKSTPPFFPFSFAYFWVGFQKQLSLTSIPSGTHFIPIHPFTALYI